MSLALNRFYLGVAQFIEKPGIRYVRRGKKPEVAKSLAVKIAEMEYKNPKLHFRVNIGFACDQRNRKQVNSERIQQRYLTKQNFELEKAAKNKILNLPMDEVYKEWIKTIGPNQIQSTADYYGVYDDLFGEAYFTPVTHLQISYEFGKGDEIIQIHQGNLVKPYEVVHKPDVKYAAKHDELYTLQLVTPDCHFTDENSEYLHWLVGNIPGNEIQKGQELCDYMQPFPLRGIGYCRYVFVLYKQDKVIDFSKYQRQAVCKNLAARTFSTYDFYKEHQDFMTPTGLAFFQADWDQTLTHFFHHVLEMKEPVFEYDFPPMTTAKQEWFPHQKRFNIYLDKYKDPKELQRELLVEKLKERHPFKPPPKPPKYPLAFHIPPHIPSWLNDDIRRRRMREGKWKLM